MRRKTRTLLIIIIIVVIVAAGSWYFFFRNKKTSGDNNTNTANNNEDPGHNSLIDTAPLGSVDVVPDLEDIDYYIEELGPPDTNINISFE